MAYRRILTVQDISCVGQCSLTVALPIISACGVEASVLPSAVLSTHTAGFKGYTFRDLTEDMPLIKKHWISEGIEFDAIYTGYLGSTKQIDYVKELFDAVDPRLCIGAGFSDRRCRSFPRASFVRHGWKRGGNLPRADEKPCF